MEATGTIQVSLIVYNAQNLRGRTALLTALSRPDPAAAVLTEAFARQTARHRFAFRRQAIRLTGDRDKPESPRKKGLRKLPQVWGEKRLQKPQSWLASPVPTSQEDAERVLGSGYRVRFYPQPA
jgi:hypothetical protein